MNRPLKLKFWCDEHGFVSSGFGEPIEEVLFNQRDELGLPCPLCFKSRPMKLLLFTGLQDKNGVEIYEGDIVQFYRHDDLTHKHEKRHIASIYWANGGFQFTDLYSPNRTLASLWNPGESMEVIGNIYENPELVNG